MIDVNYEWLRMVLGTITALYREELSREADDDGRAACLDMCINAGAHDGDLRDWLRRSDEWAQKHAAVTNPVGRANGPIRRYGPRAVGDDDGPKLYVGLSRFYWLWAMKYDPDRVRREMDADVAAGYRYARVLLQVGNLRGDTYWDGREVDPDWPDHEELVNRLHTEAAQRGFCLLDTLIGKGHTLGQQNARRPYVRRMASVLKHWPNVVLTAEMMNEPAVLGDITPFELLELERVFRETAPELLTATGAVWTERGWHDADPNFAGDTAFTPEGWALTQAQIGIAHLDRSAVGHEGQDRAWRQGWDIGLEGRPWIDNEPIGPGASVASESRPDVLRSYRAVSLICRAFATCFHCDAGIRGHGSVENTPGYRECPKAIRFLPGDMVNGQPQNANERFADRHWDLSPEYMRAESGRGIVRAYGISLGGKQYTIPFGPVSDYVLTSTCDLAVREFSQDVGCETTSYSVRRGERVRFDVTMVDRLLVSEAV